MTRFPATLRAAALSLLLLPCPPASGAPAAGTRAEGSAGLASMRRAPSRVLGDVTPLVDRPGRPEIPARGARTYASADTISVFTDSLETLSSPSSEGGWTHVDESGQPTAWNISNVYGCGSLAFWCGVVDSSWTGDPNRLGYANSWVQTLENFADLSGAPSPYAISFRHRMNVESGFDFGTVEVLDWNESWVTIGSYTGVVNDTPGCGTATLTIPDSLVASGTPTRFRFVFTSDIEGSSADGLYAAGEGWAIDDVTVKGGVFDIRFFDDMEAGMGTWTRSSFPPVGDYWRIVSNPVTQQVCTTNLGKVWQATNAVSGALVPRIDDKLISPVVAVNGADQVFLFFDVYRDLPIDACYYYGISFRTRMPGVPWSAWVDPTGLLYYGVEREWLRQTITLAGAAGADSVQFRIGVKDWGPILCGGTQTASGTDVLFDNFRVGVIGAAGPSLAVVESDLYNDTFRATPFFGDDNFNTPQGDSVVVSIGAANGLKTARLQYSLNNAAFVAVDLTRVGTTNRYYGDVPAGSYARGTELRYYFSATDSLDQAATLPPDALSASHYYRATVLPGIHATSGGCPDDTARILYVNASAGPDGSTPIDQSLGAIGARYDRYDVNAPGSGLGNSPGGGPAGASQVWPAAPLGTLGVYRAIVWDVGDRQAQTLSEEDQTLLQSWVALTGANRGLLLAGDNLAYDLVVNGQGITNFLTCTLGASYLRDVWENAPQDSLTPTLTGSSGTRIASEPFPIQGGCPDINRFDGLAISSCVGANGRAWIRYPNAILAATERLGALGTPGGDSLKVIVLGFSLPYMTGPARRNLLLYRTLAEEFEVPSCYPATAVEAGGPSGAPAAPKLHPAVPNPFNPHTMLRFELSRAARVRLRVFGVDGRLVRTLADGPLRAGEHRRIWDGRDDRGREAGSGAYFVRLETDGSHAGSRKVILLR